MTKELTESASIVEAPSELSVATSESAASPSSVSASNTPEPPSQPQSSATPSRPSLVPLGSSQSSNSTAAPHPKKFSAVNVNKKFLEKTAQAASATPSSASSAAKLNAAIARPTAPPIASHSRLVTAKLTANPISSTAGWSRPASVASTANASPNSTSPLPTSAITPNQGSAAPQLPHSGKVIQPQPKSVAQLSHSTLKDSGSGNKPVWGNPNPPSAAPVRYDIPSEDFPTAAEAVKGTMASAKKPAKVEDSKSEAAKQARQEDADAFRGRHLDPNAHHWDEMEEDDDDFLGGVVEFGDGRQYKVESVDGGDTTTTGAEVETVRDRFLDDFDRSWPRSGNSPQPSSKDLPVPQHDTRSPREGHNGLHPSSSPVESRALFNERSNRLEPYNHAKPGPPLNTKRGFLDGDSRQSRDFNGTQQHVQVLHKPPGDFPSRNRRFSGASNGSAAPSMSPRDNYFPRRDGPPPSPRMSRDGAHLMAPSTSHGGRERDGARRGAMGPPPVPPRALKNAQETGRQLPPHLTQVPPLRREPRPEPLTPASSKAPSLPSHSPLLSAAPLSAVSPVIGSMAGLPLPPGANLDEVRKDVMHNAAARAKQRREQEEAEREAQKERARKKAQELEEKMKAAALEKEKKEKELAEAEARDRAPPPVTTQDATVNSFIEDAVKRAKSIVPTQEPSTTPITKQADPNTHAKPAQPIVKTDSWRSTGPPAAPAQQQQRRLSSGFVASATTALDAAVDSKQDDLEVVDFSDMSQFMHGPRSNEAKVGQPASARPPRPTASDFFEDKQQPADSDTNQSSTWRRKPAPSVQQDPTASTSGDGPNAQRVSPLKVEEPVADAQTISVAPSASREHSGQESTSGRHDLSPPSGPPRSPRSQTFYKEATMSSLDDTMSRIKGAIVHMKTGPPESHPAPARHPGGPSTLRPAFREKWVPPALRPRPLGFIDDDDREVFDVTMTALPPTPPLSTFMVQLPAQSRVIEPLSRKQMQLFQRVPLPARFEVLSFEPPVEGMTRKEFTVTDVLFRKPIFKGKLPKYRVALPRRQSKMALRGFGKGPVDNTASWRKPASGPSPKSLEDTADVPASLETMSRSPPPETLPSETNAPSLPKTDDSSRIDSSATARARPQPKMPVGSSVAIMRDSKIDVVEANIQSSVNFIVSDELEESRESAQTMEDLHIEVTVSSTATTLPAPDVRAALPTSSTDQHVTPSPAVEKAPTPQPIESKNSENASLNERSAPQSTHQTSPWARSSMNIPPIMESTSTVPEHLKALWEQPAEKSELRPVNSLEAIPDDLTSLPFTLQEVKSEDGATPPPAPHQPPSRMSLHEVTRAFQQVPQSSSSSSAPPRPSISPPSTNAPVARPQSGYSYAPANGMRPAYGAYPSPIASSPSPMMYPHPPPMNASPVPGRMQVNPMYPQWIPMIPTAGPNGMRPPYPTPQMMPYATSPAGTPGYPQHSGVPHNMMQHQHQAQQHGSPANRARSMPGMSPAMSQAPMYPTSPMLMHAHGHTHPPAAMPGPPAAHGYAPMPAGRSQARTDGNAGQAGHQQHPPPHSQGMYPTVGSSAPYTRSGW